AWAFVAHTDSRFDPETLRQFVRAYQRVQPLTIGELWAVAITLRIVLVENLRRAATRIVSSRAARQEADAVADRLLGVDGSPAEPDAAIRSHARHAALAPAFVVQLIHRLRDQDPRATPALRWLQERLTAQGTTSEAIVHDEHQRQGASNVTVRNIITSMRLLSDVDWREFFESVSLVDEALRAGSDFAAMDFPSRDLYRRAIEELARGGNRTELEVAPAALSAAGLRLAVLALLGLIPSIDAAVALVNRAAMMRFGATTLPGLALRGGVPSRLRTMVVVPTLLTTRAALEAQLESLEVHYLASPEGELYFALLSDWTDAPSENAAGDAALLDVAVAGIERLNRLHGTGAAGDRFLLLHRRRVWSEGQKRRMGGERKRGKP